MLFNLTEMQSKKGKSEKQFEDERVKMREQMEQQNRGMGHVVCCMNWLNMFTSGNHDYTFSTSIWPSFILINQFSSQASMFQAKLLKKL